MFALLSSWNKRELAELYENYHKKAYTVLDVGTDSKSMLTFRAAFGLDKLFF